MRERFLITEISLIKLKLTTQKVNWANSGYLSSTCLLPHIILMGNFVSCSTGSCGYPSLDFCSAVSIVPAALSVSSSASLLVQTGTDRHILTCQHPWHLEQRDLYSSGTSGRRFGGNWGATMPLPSHSEKKPPENNFFLGSTCPKAAGFVPGTDATGSETAWEAGTQNSLIHGKELGLWLISSGSRQGSVLPLAERNQFQQLFSALLVSSLMGQL